MYKDQLFDILTMKIETEVFKIRNNVESHGFFRNNRQKYIQKLYTANCKTLIAERN